MRIVLLSFILVLLCQPVLAQNNTEKLNDISRHISQLQHSVAEKQALQNTLQNELGTIEQQIGQVNHRVYSLQQKIKQQQRLLQPLQRQQYKLEQQLKTQRQALTQQVLATYKLGTHSAIQLLLSQQQPSDITRMMTYYKKFYQARQVLIQQYLQSLKAVAKNQAKINQVLNQLQQLQQQHLAEEKVLRQKIINRKQLLRKIKRQITTSKQRIRLLLADKKRLQNVVNDLAVEKQLEQLSGQSFARLKHKLTWPVHGRLTRNYGQLYDGRLRSNGVFISAKSNSAVRAVASGQVIFANWLRGYGNMIIVSHKGGYMSLYAHNNSNLVAVGDSVKAGERIALSGNSGGLVHSGLYFEIRYRGRTQNPAIWCR